MSEQRQRCIYFVDKKVQGALLVRAARYWFLSILVVGTLTVLGWIFISPGLAMLIQLRQHLPLLLGGVLIALFVSICVLPVILLDLMRMSNRFAGPMLRLSRAMKQAATGETVEPVYFRDNDYWQEFADAFNQLNARLQTLEKTVRHQEAREPSTVV